MKKLLLATLALVLISVATVSAQTSVERIANLTKLVAPKASGLPKIDQMVAATQKLSAEAIVISPLLETVKEKVESGDISEELIAEASQLGKRISTQSETLKSIPTKITDAADEIKSIKNPMKIKGATSAMNYAKEATAITTEETVYQVSTIVDLVKKLTPSKELTPDEESTPEK